MLPLFISLISLLVISILFFLFIPIIRKRNIKRKFISIYGKQIYKFAFHYDFYLINRLILQANDDSKISIDHLLLANKYIFVINDCYLPGAISAKEKDQSWIYYYGDPKNPKRRYIDNPLLKNIERLSKLSQITCLDAGLLISIVLINDDCLINEYENTDDNNYLVKRKDLPRLIKNIEDRDVSPLDEEQLRYAVHDLARLNLNPHE
jgi:hypothetical protein